MKIYLIYHGCKMVLITGGALPYHNDIPTQTTKVSDVPGVAVSILAELVIPKPDVGFGTPKTSIAQIATMPETSMYENSNAKAREDNIWGAGQSGLVYPIRETATI